MVAACLVVRSERSLAPDRISPGRRLQAARGLLELPDDLDQLVGHRIGVRLQLVEGALIVAGHPLRQIGIGQGRQHLAGFADAAIDRFDQIVDARRPAH